MWQYACRLAKRGLKTPSGQGRSTIGYRRHVDHVLDTVTRVAGIPATYGTAPSTPLLIGEWAMTNSKVDPLEPRAYGDYLTDRFYLEEAPKSHVTRARTRGQMAVTQLKQDSAMPEPSKPIAYDEAYLAVLMISDVTNNQLWQDGRAVKTDSIKAGDSGFIDLRRDPINFCSTPTNTLHFYLPRTVLIEAAEQQEMSFSGELDYKFGSSFDDPILRHLGLALLQPSRQETILAACSSIICLMPFVPTWWDVTAGSEQRNVA
jgi:hypothetical protein